MLQTATARIRHAWGFGDAKGGNMQKMENGKHENIKKQLFSVKKTKS